MTQRTRTAVVTGGAGGIGESISRALAAAGHRVVITYNTGAERAEKLAAELGGLARPFDLADPSSARELVATVREEFGAIEILVNNAVVWPAASIGGARTLVDLPEESWATSMRANVEGTLGLTKAALPGMLDGGWGRVVLVSTGIVRSGMAGGTTYGAAKAALHGAARSLAWDVGRAGVTVNVVLPGFTATERILAAGETMKPMIEHAASLTPLGRLATPDEVAAAVGFFASAGASGITGAELVVDGGRD